MKTILLAYDDSASGEAALERAAELTARLDAKLIVLTVAPTLISVGHGGGLDPIDSVARRDWMLGELEFISPAVASRPSTCSRLAIPPTRSSTWPRNTAPI